MVLGVVGVQFILSLEIFNDLWQFPFTEELISIAEVDEARFPIRKARFNDVVDADRCDTFTIFNFGEPVDHHSLEFFSGSLFHYSIPYFGETSWRSYRQNFNAAQVVAEALGDVVSR